MADLYPPSVVAPDIELAASSAHRRSAARLVLGLLGFAVIYVVLIVGCIAAPSVLIQSALLEPALWVLAGPGSLLFGLLIFVLVRGLVHRAGVGASAIEVTRVEQPRLFAFLERLANEAGAPMPDRVSLSSGVNAAMLRSPSAIGLVFGGRRELVLGLGLINVLDLRELKAVIAHELGHFAQSSTRIGQWAHRTTVLLREIVVGRDRFDDRLAAARGSRFLLVRGFAALLSVGVRGVRSVLALWLAHIARLSLALAREMEFNADLHAVALCGSDPIVAALWRAQRGALAMNSSLALLRELAKHGVFSADLYRHQDARWAEFEGRSAAIDDPMIAALRAPYRYGSAQHFPAGEAPVEVMWYSHPSYRERETNAKRCYVETSAKRWASAWALFDDQAALRGRATRSGYAQLGFDLQHASLRSADEVELRIAEELAEREQGAHYFGFYDNRIIELGNLDALIGEAQRHDEASLAAIVDTWRGAGLERFMQRWRATDARLDQLRALDFNRAPVELEGVVIERSDAIARLAEAEGERERQRSEARIGDRAVFSWLWRRAEFELRVELEGRHRFLEFVQTQIVTLNHHRGLLAPIFAALGASEYQQSGAPTELLVALDALHRDLEGVLATADTVALPDLRNLESVPSTREFLLGDPLVPRYQSEQPLRAWLGPFMAQVTRVHDRLRALHYKNLGRLLAVYEAIESGQSTK